MPFCYPDRVHPIIRIVCFLMFAAWLAFGGVDRLWAASLLLGAGYMLTTPSWIGQAVRMSLRLRWFFASLLVVYGWFTPGRSLWPDAAGSLSAAMPTAEGLAAGLVRIAALILIVFAVNLLLRATPRDQLLAALHGLARPLAILGVSRERIALRMVLVMDALGDMRERVRERVADRPRELPPARQAAAVVAALIREVIDGAGRTDRGGVRIELGAAPSLLQWCYPALLCAFFIAWGRLVAGLPV